MVCVKLYFAVSMIIVYFSVWKCSGLSDTELPNTSSQSHTQRKKNLASYFQMKILIKY